MRPGIICIALLTGLLSCKEASHDHKAMEHDTAAESSLYLLDSKWQPDTKAPAFKLGALRGKVPVLAMAFAKCQYVCPRIVANMRFIESKLSAEQKKQVQFVFVTIDPDRDTVAALAAYRKKMGLSDAWLLLRSSKADTRELAAALGVKYKKLDNGDFSHSTTISVLNQEGVVIHQQQGLNTGNDATVDMVAESI